MVGAAEDEELGGGQQEVCNRGHQWELCHDGTSSSTSYCCKPLQLGGVMVSVLWFLVEGNGTGSPGGSGYGRF